MVNVNIADNINVIKKDLPTGVKLIAVSKFNPVTSVKEAYDAGQRIFGESRVQEIESKYSLLASDIEWHFIGHLQTNKVKFITPYIHTIHSVDSWRLLSEIEKQASLSDRQVKCLLEIHIAEEDSKFGFTLSGCREFLEAGEWRKNTHACIGGVMGMATYSEDENKIHKEFKKLRLFFEELKQEYFTNDPFFSEISMGMSHDYKIAVEEGATMVRVGSSIFGERSYK